MRKHWADKPILRELFWFLVLPHNFGEWMRQRRARKESGDA